MANGRNRFWLWLTYSLTSVLLGSVLGYFLGWIWFLSGLFLLGYGDSGPEWVNTVNKCVLLAGLLAGIAGGQILFFQRHKQ